MQQLLISTSMQCLAYKIYYQTDNIAKLRYNLLAENNFLLSA